MNFLIRKENREAAAPIATEKICQFFRELLFFLATILRRNYMTDTPGGPPYVGEEATWPVGLGNASHALRKGPGQAAMWPRARRKVLWVIRGCLCRRERLGRCPHT